MENTGILSQEYRQVLKIELSKFEDNYNVECQLLGGRLIVCCQNHDQVMYLHRTMQLLDVYLS